MADIFPLWMLKHLPNMAACQVGISLDARGPNNTICLEDVSSLLAFIEAANYISRGAADIMIAGGTSSRLNISKQIYRDTNLLSRRLDDPGKASRPFDAGRDGMVTGEGAAALVLESRNHAQARGAKILATVAGYGRTCSTGGNDTIGSAISRSMQTAIQSSGIEKSDLAYASAFAMSTVENDAVEARAINHVLGETPVTALKSYIGFIGAGAGAVDMAAAALALETGEAPVTLNFEQPDDSCPVNVIRAQPLKLQKPAALVTGNSFAGQAVSIVLSAN
jgi:3-oxoacyl-[acyl-carrier-protein] synthase II